MNQLSDQLTSPTVTPERQANLDAHVRSRIQAEMAKLREQEQDVLAQIATALEKENIDREKALDGADSASLRHDLDQMHARVKAFEGRKRLPTEFPEVQQSRDALIACYKCVMASSPASSNSPCAGTTRRHRSTAIRKSQTSRPQSARLSGCVRRPSCLRVCSS